MRGRGACRESRARGARETPSLADAPRLWEAQLRPGESSRSPCCARRLEASPSGVPEGSLRSPLLTLCPGLLTYRFKFLQEMMVLWAFLLVIWLPQVMLGGYWTYNLKCYDCWTINNFFCTSMTLCPKHLRRRMTISVRLNSRELLVYKNCTSNCTFVYPSEVPDEAPRSQFFKTNSFYFVRCCGSINCNEGGPISLEKDIVHEDIIEEHVVAMAHMGESSFSLSIASILVSHTLT
ncbi:glycosyl-phosphatidylinositol-anchored molecule-like protein [Lynx canadensis]|nr:glycosyl-phosphatidylinositol-anchored molecule-like protein [Lynx canadensis]